MAAHCTPEHVAALIAASRLDGMVDGSKSPPHSPTDRKQADLAFIKLCQEPGNIGDVLFYIALDSSQSGALRMNAALAAGPLITEEGWTGEGQFRQKDSLVIALIAFVQQASDLGVTPAERRFTRVLTRCLADIVALEFPTERWLSFLRTVAGRDSLPLSGSALATLASLCEVASRNYELWCVLALEVTGELVQARQRDDGAMPVSTRTRLLRCYLSLMRKRPQPSAARGAVSGYGCFLLSASMSAFVIAELQRCVAAAPLLSHGSEAQSYFEEADALLAIAQRIIRTPDDAAAIFQSAAFFITGCKDAYANREMDITRPIGSLIDNALECLLSVLQTYPTAAGPVTAGELLSTLIVFMMPRSLEGSPGDGSSFDGHDGGLDACAIADFIMDDEAVPLGCASGDIPALASSVLELFLEASPAKVPAAADAVVQFASAVGQQQASSGAAVAGPPAGAASRALRSVARVVADRDQSLLDILQPEGAIGLANGYVSLVTGFMAAGVGRATESTVALLLEALGCCFANCRSAELCCCLADLCEDVFSRLGAAGAPSVGVIGWTCIHVVARLLADNGLAAGGPDKVQLNATRLATPTWLGRALSIMADVTGGPLPVHCGSTAACAILACGDADVASADGTPMTVKAQLVLDPDGVVLLSRALHALCDRCDTRSTAELLTRMLKVCVLHTGAPPGHRADCLAAEAVAGGPLLRLADQIRQQRARWRHDDPATETLVRAIATFALDVAKARCGGSACRACTPPTLSLCLGMLVAGVPQGPLALDDAGSRARCAAVVATLVALQPCGEGGGIACQGGTIRGAVMVVVGIVLDTQQQNLSRQTVSTCCAYLAAACIAFPAETISAQANDPVYQALLSLLIAVSDALPRASSATEPLSCDGGANFLGQGLLLSAFLVARPEVAAFLLSASAGSDAGLPSQSGAEPLLVLLAWTLSLMPFADGFTLTYVLGAMARVLDYAASSPGAAGLVGAPLPDRCCLCYLQSVLVKAVPVANCIFRATLADGFAFGALSAQLRHTRSAKVHLLAPEVAGAVSLNSRWAVLVPSQQPPVFLSAVDMECASALCGWVLERIGATGFEASTAAVRNFVCDKLGVARL